MTKYLVSVLRRRQVAERRIGQNSICHRDGLLPQAEGARDGFEMKSFGLIAVLAVTLMAVPAVYAQQASAPAGSSGQCKDGSYTNQPSKRGACNGHKGVQEWYSANPSSSSSKAAATPATAVAAAAPASKKASSLAPAAKPVSGGGPGVVWVNSSSKAYHCQGDKWYGTTKHGSYMSEADAKAKGYHGDHGKSCTQ